MRHTKTYENYWTDRVMGVDPLHKEREKLRNTLQSVLWNADDDTNMSIFRKWASKHAKHLIQYDDSLIINAMNIYEMENFLKYFDILSTSNKYNI